MVNILKYLCFSIFFFNLCSIYSQSSKIDSLKLILNEEKYTNNESRLNIIYEFCKEELNKSELDSFKVSINYLISEAKFQKNSLYVSLAYQLLSDKYRRIGKYKEAISTANQSLKISKYKLNDSLHIINLNLKANVFKFFDKTDSSYIYFQKAIGLGIKSDQFRPLGYSYNGLASLLVNTGKYEEAIKTQQKCLSIATKNDLEYLEISSLVGLGWLYIVNEDYEKSLNYLKDAETKFENISDRNQEQECDIYRFIGLNYSRKGNVSEGNKYNMKALECLEATNNIMIASDVVNTIGANYLRNKEYTKAIPYFKKLINNAQTLNSKEIENFGIINLSSALIETNQLIEGETILLQILNDTIGQEVLPKRLEKTVYQNLSDLYERKGEYQYSLGYHQKFKHLEDSLNASQKLKEVAEIDAKYLNEKQEKELHKKESIIQKNKIEKLILFALVLIIISITLLLILHLYKRRKQLKSENNKYLLEVERGHKLEQFIKHIQNAPRQISGVTDNKFHLYIMEKLSIEELQLKVYLLVVKGMTNRDISNSIHTSVSNVKKRLIPLYDAIKKYKDIDYTKEEMRQQSVKVFHDLYVDFVSFN